MTYSRIFLALLLCCALIFTGMAYAVERPAKNVPIDNPDLVKYLTKSATSATPSRDVDDYLTLRYAYSADGGATWSSIMGTGDHGMYEDDGSSAWGGASYDFGTIVDNDNNLHFAVILNAFNPDNNPMDRDNGLYDVMANMDGEATYTLIAAEGDNMNFVFSDIGKDADGNLYAIWHAQMLDEEGEVTDAVIYAARTTDGVWGDPMMVVDGLDPAQCYPHVTPMVGDYLYIVYEIPNLDTGVWDQFVAKVAASFEGDPMIYDLGVASGVDYSYYVGSTEPISQDPDAGAVYVAIRSEDLASITVINSVDGGDNWNVESIAAAQRYPSVYAMGGTPYVVSNYGVPAEVPGVHKNYYAYDEFGYNGGSWIGPVDGDGLDYDGTKWLLYCHNSVWTPAGSWVRGCNAWGSFTPDGYVVSKMVEDAWTDPQFIWSIYDEEDTFVGGFITQNQLNAGTEDYVWLAFCGKYGESDFDGPMVTLESVSSYMLGEDKVVTYMMEDATGVDYLSGYTWLNWIMQSDDEGYVWDGAVPDSMMIDEDTGNGTYYFHLPDSVKYQIDEETFEMRALEAGAVVLFYGDAYDVFLNYGAEHNGDWLNVWTVNEGIENVDEIVETPVAFELGTNYPNPFNNSTVIPFSLNRAADVKIQVFDINGRAVATLFDGRADAGAHTVAWHGEGVSTGIYFYSIETAGVRQIAKMTLVR